jgi:glyoxylase-like metal-dependent hydrolase (beta-lactamase superfamily II)
MNRRRFLTDSAALAALALSLRHGLNAQTPAGSAPGASPSAPPPTKTEFKALRRNVGIFNGRGGTIGWLSSRDALAVVDTQFPDTARACLAGLPERGERMIDVVINTHHHGDHTSGNPVFRPAAKRLVAHENVPELQRLTAAKANPPAAAPVVADTTFAESWKMELGDETVHARYFGVAHTKGDIAVHFEKANVVHLGDLMFNRIYPVIDRPNGASIKNWIHVLEKIQAEYPADAIFIGGHGNPKFGVTLERKEIAVFGGYLHGLLEHTQREIAAGKSKAEIATLENLPGFPDFHQQRPNRLSSNLNVAYDELTGAEIKS